jgi:ABC-type nitrate/sulfonate/bicarbonate transport system permease component
MSSPASSRSAARWVLPVAGLLLLLGVWQCLASGPLRDSNLPGLHSTFRALRDVVGEDVFWTSVLQTLRQALVGFALSVAVALPLGLYVGTSPFGQHATKVLIEVLKPIPAIVVLPLAVLQLGTSDRLAVFLVMFTLVPMLTVTVAAGARDADPVMLDAARSYGLGRVARTWLVVMPNAVPFIATGLRVGASFALILAVLAGLYGGAPGLGHDLDIYRQAGLLDSSFAYVLVLGVLGIALNAMLSAGERKVLFWHESVRKDDAGSSTAGVGPTATGRKPGASHARLWAVQDTLEGAVRRVTARPAVRRLGRLLTPRRPPVSDAVWRWVLRLITVLVPVLVVAVWWVRSANSENPFFPPLSETVESFRAVWLHEDAFDNVVPSLRNLGLGFGLGTAAGIVAGAVIGQVRWLFWMLSPLISFFRSIPSIAYLPILIAVIGFTSPMRVTAISLAAFFPVLIAAIDGVRGIDETLLDATRSYQVPSVIAFFWVRLPAAVPRIFVGAELGLAAALIVMVASELIGTSQGIGAQVLLAQQTFQFADMWAGILLLAAIGIMTNLLFRAVRSRLLGWYDGARAASRAQ